HNPTTRTSAPSALRGDLGLTLAAVWLLAALAFALRPRERAVRTLALGALAWLALLAAMAAAGYASPARYGMPAAAVACVLAGAAIAALTGRLHASGPARAPARERPVAWGVLVLLAATALAVPAAARIGRLDDQIREGTAVARSNEHLRAAIAAAGGADALRRCALDGWVAVNHTTQTALAWELAVPLDRVARTMSRPGLLVRAGRSEATGAPPPVVL